MGRILDLHRRATSRRPPRPPLALGRPLLSLHVLAWLLGLAVLLLGGLWAVESWLLEGPLPALDRWGLERAATQRTATLLTVARAANHLGEVWVLGLVGAVAAGVARVRSGRWDAAALGATVLVGVVLVTTAGKLLTARPRPEEALTSTVSLAFPSGHASRTAAVGALVVWLVICWARHPLTRHLVAVLVPPLVVATGWSRVVLGAHWPTDVLAGWVVGLLWTAATLVLLRPVPAPRRAPGRDRPPATGRPSPEGPRSG